MTNVAVGSEIGPEAVESERVNCPLFGYGVADKVFLHEGIVSKNGDRYHFQYDVVTRATVVLDDVGVAVDGTAEP